ncbi:MAG: hypothetical protein ACYSUQ_05760 [Planctomycetota bacterium]|jgi:hypothetical protein
MNPVDLNPVTRAVLATIADVAKLVDAECFPLLSTQQASTWE